jgi:hypothetical protein
MARATKPAVLPWWAETAANPADIEQPSNSFITAGWPLSAIPPARQFFNWILNRADAGLRYLLQRGISDWDSAEDGYGAGDVVRDPSGLFFRLEGTATTGLAPAADTANWRRWYANWQPLPGDGFNAEIMAWKNAAGLVRGVIDHQGNYAGKIQRWQEQWADASITALTAPNSAGTGKFFGRWNYGIENNNGTPAIGLLGAAAASLQWSSTLSLQFGSAPGTANALAVELAHPPVLFDPDLGIALQWDHVPLVAATGNECSMGLLAASLIGTTNNIATQAPAGLAFVRRSGDSNWFAYVRPAGGAATFTDTGVSASAVRRRFRIDWLGANVSGDTNPRAIFIIDGNIRNNIIVDVVNGASPVPAAIPSFRQQGTIASQTLIGVTDFFANLWAGSVTL